VKSKWIAASIAACVMSAGGVAFAQGESSGSSGSSQQQMPPGSTSRSYQKGTTSPPSHLRTFSLKVKDVDADNHVVDFQAKVKPEANITESGQAIKLDQLKPGDEVRASFDPATNEVVRLDVIKAPRQQQQQQQQPQQ
jgi:hypothetical protein